jgi:hypothetical protein
MYPATATLASVIKTNARTSFWAVVTMSRELVKPKTGFPSAEGNKQVARLIHQSL